MPVRIRVPNLDDERRNTVIIYLTVLVWDTEAGEDKSVIGGVSHLSGPPLRSVQRGRVKDELVLCHVERGGRFQASNV